MAANKGEINQEKAAATVPRSSIGTSNQTFFHDPAVRNKLQVLFKTYVEKLIAQSEIMPVPTILGNILFGVEKKTVDIYTAQKIPMRYTL